MKRKLVLLLCMVSVLSFTFQACEDEDNTAQVGVCIKDKTNDWRKSLKYQAEINLNKYGLKYRIYQASNTAQEDTLLRLIDYGCNVLIIMPEGVTEAGIAKAAEANIPIVFAESTVGSNYEAFIKIDNETIGKSAAEFFNSQENLNKIALFTVEQDETSSSRRISGIKAGLKDELKDKIIEKTLKTYTSADGKAAVQEILSSSNADYQDVDAIYAQDDDIAMGVLEALEADTKKRIKVVVGCGGSSAFFKKIKESEAEINLATTLYSPAQFMEKSVEVANNLLMGIPPESKIIELPSTLIDKSNVDSFNNYAY